MILDFLTTPITLQIIIMVLSIITLVLLTLTIKNSITLKKITQNSKNANIAQTIEDYYEDVKILVDETKTLINSYENSEHNMKSMLQKVGMVRYDGFDETGGQLSFSIALLDQNNNGFVLTSMYGRNSSNTYMKNITNTQSDKQLSEYEIEAINRAMESFNKNYKPKRSI